jgi:hypothetical protein
VAGSEVAGRLLTLRLGGRQRVNTYLLWLAVAVGATGLDADASVAQTSAREPAFRGTSFVLGRYASTGTMTVYGAYAVGPVMGLVGVVQNLRADSRVLVVGGGTRVRMNPRGGLTMLAALAGGSGGTTVRLFLLPSFRFGRWRLSGTATAQLPLETGGQWKASLDPLTVSYGVTRTVGAGLATVVRRETGGSRSVGAGPAVALRLARTTTGVEFVRMTRSRRVEVRLNVGVAF